MDKATLRPKWFEYIRVQERRMLGTKIKPDFLIAFGPTNIVKPHSTNEKAERQVESIRNWIWNHMMCEAPCDDAQSKIASVAYDKLKRDNEALLRAAKALVEAMGTCHICHGDVIVNDGPTRCEDCLGDCDSHDEPDCPSIEGIYLALKKAIAQAEADHA